MIDDVEYMTEENAIKFRDELEGFIAEFAPHCDIIERDRLLEIGCYQYIWHMANGFCHRTSMTWARNHIANSDIAREE